MFSDVWSNICCLWSRPSSSLSLIPTTKPGGTSRPLPMFRRLFPTATIFVLKVQQVPESLHRCARACCEVPSAAERGSPNSATSLPPRMAHQTVQPLAPASVDVKCHKYIFQLGSMCPKDSLLTRPGWFPERSWSAHFPIRSMNSPIPDHRISFGYLLTESGCAEWTHHGPVTHCVTQDFSFTKGMLPEERSPKVFHSVPKDCGKLWDGKWCFFGHNWHDLWTCLFAQLGFS